MFFHIAKTKNYHQSVACFFDLTIYVTTQRVFDHVTKKFIRLANQPVMVATTKVSCATYWSKYEAYPGVGPRLKSPSEQKSRG